MSKQDVLKKWVSYYLHPTECPPQTSATELEESLPLLNQQGVAGAISHLALAKGIESKTLRDVYQTHFVNSASHLSEARRLGALFQKENLKVILLKGGHLLHTVYATQLGYRPISDLDLLVAPHEIDLLKKVLSEHGYQPASYADYIWIHHEGFEIDLHTSLLSRAEPAFNLRTHKARETAIPLAQTGLYGLENNHLALHLMLHALKHGFTRISWSIDLVRVFQQLDSHSFLQLVKETGTHRALAYTQWVLQQQLNYSIPNSWYGSIPSLSTFDHILLKKLIEPSRAETLGMIAYFFAAPYPKNKWEYLKSLSQPYLTDQTWSQRLLGLATSIFKTIKRTLLP